MSEKREPRVYENKWNPGARYSDMQSHFLRMDADRVSQYFAVNGVFASWPNSPNWVDGTPEGYELVQLDGDEIVNRTGVFITIKEHPSLETAGAVKEGKGKTVAYWNYHFVKENQNEPDKALKFSSDDELKGIVAYGDGSVYANACRFTRYAGQLMHRSQLIIHSIDGLIHHTPFVNLAFFQWLDETTDGQRVRQWLAQNMGWRDAPAS